MHEEDSSLGVRLRRPNVAGAADRSQGSQARVVSAAWICGEADLVLPRVDAA